MSYLCLKRDIKDGEYEVFKGFDRQVIVKKEAGNLTVSENACHHRGHKVAQCGGKGAIKCPYHGQRFDFARGSLPHYEFGEFVFLPGYLQHSQRLGKISLGAEFSRIELFVAAPFHLWMQNEMDPNQIRFTQPKHYSELFDGFTPEDVYLNEFESSYQLRIKEDVVERYRKHFPLCSDHLYHHAGFPNLSVTSLMDAVYSVESLTPANGGCKVNQRLFLAPGIDNKAVRGVFRGQALAHLIAKRERVETWADNYFYNPQTTWLPGDERIKRYADEIRTRNLE